MDGVRKARRKAAVVALKLRRANAYNMICKAWRTYKFNREMSPFILFCARYDRNDFEIEKWNSTIIQSRFRGYKGRKRAAKIKYEPTRRMLASIVMQKMWRAYAARMFFRRHRRKMKRMMYRWRVRILLSYSYHTPIIPSPIPKQ